MPEMDGIELTQTLRQAMNSPIKIIGVSAGELDNDRQTCLDAGMNDHLSKPFKANDLLNKIQLHACVEKLT
jgi:CheY-like chemotaxis protein